MALLEKYLVVQPSTIPGAGLGLFTTEFIKKGSVVIEYKGRITTWKEVKDDSTNAYIYKITNNHVIDARRTMKALARYANDACGLVRIKGINNNCVYFNDGKRAFIEATRNIEAGSELLVAYGKDYWDVMRKNHKIAAKEKTAEKVQPKKSSAKKSTTVNKAKTKKK